MYEELLNPPCYELNGSPDVTIFLSEVFELFSRDCSLVIECSSQTEAVRNILSAISDRTGASDTVVLDERLSFGLRYELHLGRTMPAELFDLCEQHATPEYCDHCFVLRAGVPILLWYDFGSENPIVIRPEVDEVLVRELSTQTSTSYQKLQ
jgi:hypothetical protein